MTTCDDNKIMVWDPTSKRCIAKDLINKQAGPKKKIGGASTLSVYPPNQCARAVAIGKNGHVAIGVNDGELQIRGGLSNISTIVAKKHNSKEWIEVLRYSPDGASLAVGSHDNNIYIYSSVRLPSS